MKRIRKRRVWRFALGLGALGALAYAGVAIGVPPTQTFSGSISPTSLPKHSFAPVQAKINLDVTSGDSNPPPKMLTATAVFDNQVKVNAKGVPTCNPAKLENTDATAARAACHSAIVGTGFANAKVTFPDQAPIDAPAPVTLFNGAPQGGHPQIIIHAYTTVPAPTTFIVPGVLQPAGGGKQSITYQVPPIAGGYGTLVHFDATLGAKFKVHGKRQSYYNAKCATGQITLEGNFAYEDGTNNHTTFAAHCQGRNK
jgi:hypothetical protein